MDTVSKQFVSFPLSSLFQVITDERAQELIDKAMKSGSLKQRNVVGVITGLMGSGKTTLLHHLFGMAPPGLYTSTGVAEQSLRGLLHHIIHLSADTWQRLSYKDIRELLAPMIQAGVREADVDILATRLMRKLGAKTGKPSLPTFNMTIPQVALKKKVNPPIISPLVQGPSPSCQEIVPLVTTATGPRATGPLNDLLEFVHMTDTGGQPELLEVMPSLIHNANLAMVLVDLRYPLNECPPVNRHEKGVCYERQGHSQYTGRDIILKLASTLHSKKSLDEKFRLFIIATHRDCVEHKLDTWVRTLNNELENLLLPTFEDQLILFQSPDKTAFVMNLKNPNKDDKDALALIRKMVGEPGLGSTFGTPTSFFVFEQDLLEFAKNDVKRDILSLSECKHVGARLKMSEEMVKAALVLFHRQNTFLYFRHVLPNHIFIKPQVPLDIVNGIVAFSYGVREGKFKCFPAELVTQLNKGIITEKLLGYDKISSHFKKGFYEVQDAIKLFCHTFTLAPLQPDKPKAITHVDDKQRQYLMMCLMPAIPDQKLNDYIPASSDTVPLVIKFSSGCVPLGCFGSTISCLLFKYGWEVIKDKSPKCLAHNIAALHDPDVFVNVVLVDFTQYIELHVEPDLDIHDSLVEVCSQVHRKVLGAIENVFNIMHLDTDLIKISSAVLCNICTEASEKHFAEFVNRKGKYLLRCRFKYGKPSEKQLLWMGIDAASKDPLKKPTLPLLQRFPTKSRGVIKIIDKIGTGNHDLGIRLLNDDDGTITANIEAQYKHDPPSRTTEDFLQKWLRGTGRTPQTWHTLITVLREIELNSLAQEIEENLLDIQVQTQKKQTSHQRQVETITTAQGRTDPRPKSEATTRTQGRTDPRPKSETITRTQGKTDPRPKETITRAKGRTDPRPKPETITRTQGRTDPRPMPETITRTQGRTDPRPKPETITRTDPRPKPETITRTQGRTDPRPKSETITRTQGKTDPRPKETITGAKGRTDPRPKPETITRTQGRTDPRPKPGTITRTQGRTDPRPKSETITRTQGRTDPRPKPETITRTDPRPKPETITRTQGRTDPRPKPGTITRTQGRTNPRPKSEATTRTQGRTDPRPKSEATTRAQGRTDPRPKPEAITRTQGRTDPRPKPEATTRAQGRTDPRPKPEAITRAQGRTDPRPKPETITRTQGRTDPRPKPEAITRAQGRTDPRPKSEATTRTQRRTDPRPKPETITNYRSDGRSESRQK